MLAAEYRNAQGDQVRIEIDRGSMTKKNITTGKTVITNGLSHEAAVREARKAISRDMPASVEYICEEVNSELDDMYQR